jgi:transcription initiation factor TFIID TATA-box-binding protein
MKYILMFMLAAPSVADVQAAIEYIFPLVYEFRKERTPEEIAQLALKKQRQMGHCNSPAFDDEYQEDEESDWD